MKQIGLLLILVASVAHGVTDESRVSFLYPADVSSPPLVSMSQRFVFRGFDRRDGTRLAAWTEDIAARLEKRMNRSVPFTRYGILRIEGTDDPRETGGVVYVGQGVSNGNLQQRVVVTNPGQIESEALLEAMVQVLINRYVVADFYPDGNLPEGSLIPDWFSVGMAQGLREDLRQRNLGYVMTSWKGGTASTASQILKWQVLPPGRAPEKAFCGVFLDWLEEAGGGAAFWPALLERHTDGASVDGDWLADQAQDLGSERAVNQAWDLWLADKLTSRKTLGELGFAEVAALKELLDIRLMDYGLSPVADLPPRFVPGELIEFKNEDWARSVALRLLGKLREFRVGQAPDLVAVIDQYAAYFAGFNQGPNGSLSATRLSTRLDEAQRGMTLLEKAVALQAHYMNRVEQNRTVLPEVDSTLPPVEQQRRSFLDRIEQQRNQERQP